MNDLALSSNTVALITTYSTRVIGVLLLLVAANYVSKWGRKALQAGFEKSKFDLTLSAFFSNSLRWVVLLAAIIASLEIFGVQTTSFAAVLAAAGFAIGLAFQGSLSNFSAGVMLLIFRPFKLGDYIVVGGEQGTVEEIELFTTKLDTPDNRQIILPNSTIFGAVIQNVTFHETRRVDLVVGTSYSADLDKTKQVLESALKSLPQTLKEPAPEASLKQLSASSVDWEVKVWCATKDYASVKEAALRAVKLALDKASISIPFPQIEVHLPNSISQMIEKPGRQKAA